MTFAVTERCLGCKDTGCVVPCPMGCFLEGPQLLAIDPDECIDCAMCVPECPVDAIRADLELLPQEQVFVGRTLAQARAAKWPRITVACKPPSTEAGTSS
jgi:ferredoxin